MAKQCPTCNGSGKVTVVGGQNLVSDRHDVEIDCPNCGGSGIVEGTRDE